MEESNLEDAHTKNISTTSSFITVYGESWRRIMEYSQKTKFKKEKKDRTRKRFILSSQKKPHIHLIRSYEVTDLL